MTFSNKHRPRLWAWMILAVCAAYWPAHATTVGIAAVVNDTIITTGDLEDRSRLILAMAGGKVPEDAKRRIGSQALQQLVNEALQQEEAARLSVQVKEEDVEKAIADIEKGRGRPPGSLRAFLKKNQIPEATMLQQVRTQLIWSKVVTQRLRRNVTISEDEIARAQLSEMNAPGTQHYNIAAISVAVPTPNDEAAAGALVKEMLTAIADGEAFEEVARRYSDRKGVQLNPSVWLAEDKLEPPIAAALRGLQPGQVTRPLRSLGTFQIVQFRDRREIKPLPANTEVVLKDTLFTMSAKPTPEMMMSIVAAAKAMKNSSEACVSEDVLLPAAAPQVPAKGKFMMGSLGKMTPEIIPLISLMSVGETSEPIASPEGLRVISLCEKIEPAAQLANRDEVQRKLFNEKIELEAVKHMRNLRRDAFIEVKSLPDTKRS